MDYDDIPAKIKCPDCGQPTESIKRTNILSMIFLFVGARWTTRSYVACPECTRRKLASNAAINVVTANLMFPVMILPVSLYQLACTYKGGHDRAIVEEIRTRMFNQQLVQDSIDRYKVKNSDK